MDHAHVEAALFALVVTGLVYLCKWIFGFSLPAIFGLPACLVIFVGAYILLFIVFRFLWSR